MSIDRYYELNRQIKTLQAERDALKADLLEAATAGELLPTQHNNGTQRIAYRVSSREVVTFPPEAAEKLSRDALVAIAKLSSAALASLKQRGLVSKKNLEAITAMAQKTQSLFLFETLVLEEATQQC